MVKLFAPNTSSAGIFAFSRASDYGAVGTQQSAFFAQVSTGVITINGQSLGGTGNAQSNAGMVIYQA